MEMLSHIEETAISNSSQEVKLQVKFPGKKKHPQTVDTNNQTFNYALTAESKLLETEPF